jgi:hypothetical protein
MNRNIFASLTGSHAGTVGQIIFNMEKTLNARHLQLHLKCIQNARTNRLETDFFAYDQTTQG